MADQKCPPFGNHDVITTSYDVTISRYQPQRNIFGRTIYPPRLIVIAFIIAKLGRKEGGGGGGGGIRPLVPEDKKVRSR